MGVLLLEIEVDPEKDEVFVVDRGHVEGGLYENKKGIPQKYLHPSIKRGERAYLESKIPLKEYLQRADELDYSLPEVVFFEDVPLERISVSQRQPLIEEDLKRYEGSFREGIINDIRKIPELSYWLKEHEQEREVRKEGEEHPGRRI